MNQEDIVAMAEEAGIRLAWQSDAICPKNLYVHELLRFAKLAAQAEREACAKVCDDLAEKDKLSNYYKVAANAIRGQT